MLHHGSTGQELKQAPPNLASPKLFHSWLQERLSENIPVSHLLTSLRTVQSELSLCRQMNLTHFTNYGERRDYVEPCIQSMDTRVEAYALGLESYIKIAQHDSGGDGYNASATDLLPMLQGVLDDLRVVPRDPFTQEIESTLRVSIGLGHFFNRDFELAAKEASRALFLADHIGAAFCITRARSLLISISAETGQVGEAIVLLHAEEGNAQRSTVAKSFHERAHATMLYQLGHNRKPIEMLERDALLYDHGHDQPCASELQRQKCLLGIGGLEGDVVQAFPNYAIEQWITRSMRCLIKAGALPRTNQNLRAREVLLRRAVDIWREDRNAKHAWASELGRWVVGFSQLWLGSPSQALGAIFNSQVKQTQWLDLRLLIAGLGLESSLHIVNPEASVEHYEDCLRRVFNEARSLNSASPEGLAERLMHWHPLAAAYLTLLPDPIIELQSATRAVLRVGASNNIYNLVLPPTYAAELVLRALDYDLRPSPKFVQADPGPSRHKRADMLVKHGEVNYWRPSVSAVSIIYGLIKAGHRDQAHAVYHEYGVAPYSNAEYAMLPLVEHLNTSVGKLLMGRLDIRQFSASSLDLS